MRVKHIRYPSILPYTKPHEYAIHHECLRKAAVYAGITVDVCCDKRVYTGRDCFYLIMVDGQRVLVDYSDYEALTLDRTDLDPRDPAAGAWESLPCFKFHYNKSVHADRRNVFPIGPALDVSDMWYSLFFGMAKEHTYTCNSDIVISCQRPYGGAAQRRRYVQHMLRQQYGDNLDVQIQTQGTFFKKHTNCLVAVCVPGATNNMLDRGQYQQIGLGVCTISPRLNTVLPGGKELIPCEHYIACADDYSDLVEIIEWCKHHRDTCRTIGDKAKQLFSENCAPAPLWSWVSSCTQMFYRDKRSAV